MKAVRPETWIEVSEDFTLPALAPEENGAAEALARALTGRNDSGVVSYATEAGQFQTRGWSAVVCGPGNIEQAHQPDEWLALNPELKFANDQRGYLVCDVNREAWQTHFMVVDKVTTPVNTLSKRATGVVENGVAGIKMT